MICRILHFYPAYRIEHVLRLTFRQFNRMSTETASLQHAYAGMVAIGARNGVFAKSGEFSRIIRMLTTPSTDKMEKPAVSDKDLVGLGFEVT